MKICWDNLEHIILMPGLKGSPIPRWVYYENPDQQYGSKGEFIESEEPCLNCNEYFLKKKNNKSLFCTKECKETYKIKNLSKIVKKELDKRSKENGGGWQNIGKTSWNKGAGLPKDSCNFDTYNKKVNWFISTRKNPKDERILQTRCCICNKWFNPNIDRLKKIILFVNDNSKKGLWGLYCSEECENKCPHFGKTTEYIMKQDYLNNGRAKYSETHNIPDKILYYDWQVDLKKLQKLLQDKNKKYQKRKLRRRKKTELEKQRTAEKRLRKKLRKQEKEKYLNSKEYQKEYHLKKTLYLSRQRAKQKNWQHNINYEWLLENTPEKCPKCNIEFRYNKNIKMDPWAPSIDRINIEKGYTKDNCIIVSWVYNCGKNAYDENTLYIICKAFLKQFDHDDLTNQ